MAQEKESIVAGVEGHGEGALRTTTEMEATGDREEPRRPTGSSNMAGRERSFFSFDFLFLLLAEAGRESSNQPEGCHVFFSTFPLHRERESSNLRSNTMLSAGAGDQGTER